MTALARDLDVMRVFSGRDEHLTPSEIARAVDLPRARPRCSLITLVTLGYVHR